MNSNNIVITPRSLSDLNHPELKRLTQAGFELVCPSPGKMPSQEQLIDTIPNCIGWLAGVEPITSRVLKSAQRLRIISRNGSGIDNIDVLAAENQGIKITRTQGANAQGVAELTMALLFASYRYIAKSDALLRSGLWQRSIGREIRGKVLGLIGCGEIGRKVAHMAVNLGMEVLAYDPKPVEHFLLQRFSYASLDETLMKSDVVSLHCPSSKETLINNKTISMMKDKALLINTARASLINETSLLNALNHGKLHGYATDVYDSEPPKPSQLLSHELVTLMPHAGGYTHESVDRATSEAVTNLLGVLK